MALILFYCLMWNYFSWLFGMRLHSGRIFNLYRAPPSAVFVWHLQIRQLAFWGFLPLFLSFVDLVHLFLSLSSNSGSVLHVPILTIKTPMSSNTVSFSLSLPPFLFLSHLYPVQFLFQSQESSLAWVPVLEDSRSVSWACKGCPAPALSRVLTIGPCTHPLLEKTETLTASVAIFKLAAQLLVITLPLLGSLFSGSSPAACGVLLCPFLLTRMLFLWKFFVCSICFILGCTGSPCHLLL